MPFFFAITLFVSATLLFLVQPMIAKMILPSLGGTPSVWNTCMVFFQAVLLAGYAYAHATTAWLGVRRQAALHVLLLLTPFLVLPIAISKDWVPPVDANPIPWLLALLLVSVGLPFFVVSASAPLLQKWFAETGHPSAQDPYYLYGASNLGSMLALLSYPTLVEPSMDVLDQSWFWRAGYVLLVLLTFGCAFLVWRAPASAPKVAGVAGGLSEERPTPGKKLWWIGLAIVPSSLMLGVTTYLTTDIAAIPLLWVIPLALYLLSFIIVFSWWPAPLHQVMILLLPVIVLALLFQVLSELRPAMWAVIVLHLAALFVVAMVCHGELARSRPSTHYLTGFYLLMSLGGVLGGLFNALVAPVLFNTLAEYPLALVLACLFLPRFDAEKARKPNAWLDLGSLSALLLLAGALLYVRSRDEDLDFLKTASLFGLTLVQTIAILALLAAGLSIYLFHRKEERASRLLDMGVAAALGLLTVALILGLDASRLKFEGFSELVNDGLARMSGWLRLSAPLHVETARLQTILMYGLPALLCYTLVTRPVRFGLAVGAVFVAGLWCAELDSQLMHRERGFFGVLTVWRWGQPGDNEHRRLIHGDILHGMQCLEPDREREPLTYYHSTGPIGQVFEVFTGDKAKKHLAFVGLGTGTLACYGEKGQRVTFYDINPAVVHIARDSGLFTYVGLCPAELDIVLGDARLKMEQAPDHAYGLIVLDAFSSDAIPVHLVTREAVELYRKKLEPDGILAFHISNRYVNLEPVLANAADDLGMAAISQYDQDEEAPGKSRSHWVLLANKVEDFGPLAEDDRWTTLKGEPGGIRWTDAFSNLYKVFEW